MNIVITDGKSTKYVSDRTWELLQQRKNNKWRRINTTSLSGDVIEYLNSRLERHPQQQPPKQSANEITNFLSKGVKKQESTNIPFSIPKIKNNLINYSKDDLLADNRKGVNALAELK